MSTYWDVYCKDCQESAGIDNLNHGENIVREIIAHKHEVASSASITHLLSHGLQLGSGSYLDASWFAQHAQHRLVPRSEYGDVLDDKCGACGAIERLSVGGYGKPDYGVLCESCLASLKHRTKELLLKTAHLSIWHRTSYWVIAASEEQAWQLYEDETGDSDRDPDSGWTRLDDAESFSIYLDGEGDITDNEDGSPVELPCWVWVAKYGEARYLCREM